MDQLRNCEYRIYPSNKQLDNIYSQFRLCSEVYNLLLAERENAYEECQRTLAKKDLCLYLTVLKRQDPRFKAVHSQVLQNQADRLVKAFENFFRRCKEKKEGANIDVGYPRYKKMVHSITYPQNNGSFKVEGNKLDVSKIGRIPMVLHRPIPGRVKTLTIKRNRAGQFFAVFGCEVNFPEPPVHQGPEEGLDQGLGHLVVGSDGFMVEARAILGRRRGASRSTRGGSPGRRREVRTARRPSYVWPRLT